MDLLAGHLRPGALSDGLAGVRISIEVGEEARGHVDTDAVAGAKQVRSHEAIQPDGNHDVGLEEHHLVLAVAVAGPDHLHRRTHQVERASVRMDVEKANDEVGVPGRGGNEELDFDVSRDLDVLLKRVGLVDQNVLAAFEGAD